MCFSGEMSGLFSVLGLVFAFVVWKNTTNKALTIGVFYYFTMEFLQFIQYFLITSELTPASCAGIINKIFTLLGFLHICFQPWACHVINAALTKDPKYLAKYDVILRLCAIGGSLLFLRYFLSTEFLGFMAAIIPSLKDYFDASALHFNKMAIHEVSSTFTNATGTYEVIDRSDTTEWLRGNFLCTFKSGSMWHLGWSVPMADPSYYVMGAGIHSFLMFAPFAALYEKKGMLIQGAFLFFTGPVMADNWPVLATIMTPYVKVLYSPWEMLTGVTQYWPEPSEHYPTTNLHESASIWCFFSIAQIGLMLFLIRETLLKHWGRGSTHTLLSDVTGAEKKAEVPKKTEEVEDKDAQKKTTGGPGRRRSTAPK